jgi:membrane protease YdiL (CAAX protease family)
LWIGFVGAVALASRSRGTGRIRDDMGLHFGPWDILIGPAVGLGGQLVLLPVLYAPLQHFIPNLQHRLSDPARHLTGGFPGADLALIGALTVVIVPVVEELFFRGLILRALVRLFRVAGPVVGPALAMVVTGVVFGLAHLETLQLLGLAVFGIVLSAMAYGFRRLGPSVLAHATFNLIAILAVGLSASAH